MRKHRCQLLLLRRKGFGLLATQKMRREGWHWLWGHPTSSHGPRPLRDNSPNLCYLTSAKTTHLWFFKATMRERRAQQPQGRPNPAVQFSSLAVCIYIWVTIQGAIKVGTNTSLHPGLVGRRKGHLHREGSTRSRGEEMRVSEGPRKVCRGISGTGPGSQAQRTSKSS